MTGFIVFLVIIAVLALALKALFWFVVIKTGVALFNAHQRAFDHELQALQKDLGKVRSMGQVTPDLSQRMTAEFLRAQRELNQLADLRRQQSETRLNGMRSDLASAGIFIDSNY